MSEKIYICNFCDKEYKSRNGLWSHKKKCKNKLEKERLAKIVEDMKLHEKNLEESNKRNEKLMNDCKKILINQLVLENTISEKNEKIIEQKEQITQLLEQNRLLLEQLKIKNASINNNDTN